MNPFSHNLIQKTCTVVISVLFAGIVLNCGSGTPLVETVRFSDSTVSFSNNSCPVAFTMANSSNNSYTIASLIGTFEDANGDTDEITVTENDLAEAVEPSIIPPYGTSEAVVNFNLADSGLTPPLQGTIIVVGVAGSQVTHFVGNFECE